MPCNEQTLTNLCQQKRQGNCLNLAKCSIDDDDISTLLDFVKAQKISQLDISENHITSTGAELLATCETLIVLKISFNSIGSSGAIALAKNLHLRTLLAVSNSIGFEGIEALSKNKALYTLDIKYNKLSVQSLGLFYSNVTLTQLMVYDDQLTKEHILWVKAIMARNLAHQCQPMLLAHVKTEALCRIVQSYVEEPSLAQNPMLFFNLAARVSTSPQRELEIGIDYNST